MDKCENMVKIPLVSVIIPTYARPDNLLRAINSVINQTYPNVEIIVVDDNGLGTKYQKETQDLLSDIIKTNIITYIPHDVNRNGSAARNTGLYASKGIYINFLDDDDEMGIDKVSKQVEFLETNKEYGACFCDSEIVYKDSRRVLNNSCPSNWIESILLEEVFFNTSTVLFRRNVLYEINGFDESFYRHQDYELYMRFLRLYTFAKVDCIPLRKYATPNIISRNPKKCIDYMEKFLNTFRDDILSQNRGKEIFRYEYEKLTELLLASMCYKEAFYTIRQSFRFGIPSIKRLLRYCYFLIRPAIHGRSIN